MLEISKKGNVISIKNSDKIEVIFDIDSKQVHIDGFDANFPGEYEKGGVLSQVKEYEGNLFYNFKTDDKNVSIITTDKFDPKEDILKFLENIDVLFILGSKDATKTFENIEAKLVIPYGENKHAFLSSEGQNLEEVSVHKIKGDLHNDDTEFVNLEG